MSESALDPKREFHEADARLGAMHGYPAALTLEDILTDIAARQTRLEDEVNTLISLVRELRHALRAGAVGDWRERA